MIQVLKPYIWQRYSKYLSRKILDPFYFGMIPSSEEPKKTLIVTTEGTRISGAFVTLYLLIDTEQYRISQAHYTLFGPTALLGAMEVLMILIKNKSLAQAAQMGADHMENYVKEKADQDAFPKETHSFMNLAISVLDKALLEAQNRGWMLVAPFVPEGPKEEIPNWKKLSKKEKMACIEGILDKELRPYISLDGGGVELVDLVDETLTISYQGACVGCHGATGATLSSIQSLLRSRIFPDLLVVPIDSSSVE